MRIEPGARFGKLTVLSKQARKALCRCDCGVEKLIAVTSLYSGASQSCGCLRRQVVGDRQRVHGKGYEDYRYRLWQAVKARCYRTTYVDFPFYGGRGITMHPNWVDDFSAFAEYLAENLGERPDGATLDRINNDGNYEPGNLRWATRREQALNRRNRWRYRSVVVDHHDNELGNF